MIALTVATQGELDAAREKAQELINPLGFILAQAQAFMFLSERNKDLVLLVSEILDNSGKTPEGIQQYMKGKNTWHVLLDLATTLWEEKKARMEGAKAASNVVPFQVSGGPEKQPA